MIPVTILIEELAKFPKGCFVYGYEGEGGASIVITRRGKEMGYIKTSQVTQGHETVIHKRPK